MVVSETVDGAKSHETLIFTYCCFEKNTFMLQYNI